MSLKTSSIAAGHVTED